jgi:eukaryotic-like serine/threonine-protein kinase
MSSTDSPRVESCARRAESRRQNEPCLPRCYCAGCLSITYARDRACIQCRRRRPDRGWPVLEDSGDRFLGEIVGDRYLMVRRLGEGATSRVYEAEALHISRKFAIKVVDLEACTSARDPELVRARLEREIEAIGRLRSPHTVPFYEVLELSSTCVAVVMKYIDGQTLSAKLADEGALAWPRACRLVRQIATGLHEAHQAGMIHRDLKPANIMVESTPCAGEFAYLLDFGVVWLDDGVEVTRGFVGTPLYASPEQALGEQVDRRSDIYALGVILFEMLTGRPPFESANVIDVLRMHVRSRLPSLPEASGGGRFPYQLEQLVEQMLSKSRAARPAGLPEVVTRLDAVLEEARPGLEGALPASSAPPTDRSSPAAATAPGLGLIETVNDAAQRSPADPRRLLSETVETLEQPRESKEESGRFYESDQRDATGPKAAILSPHPDARRRPRR